MGSHVDENWRLENFAFSWHGSRLILSTTVSTICTYHDAINMLCWCNYQVFRCLEIDTPKYREFPNTSQKVCKHVHHPEHAGRYMCTYSSVLHLLIHRCIFWHLSMCRIGDIKTHLCMSQRHLWVFFSYWVWRRPWLQGCSISAIDPLLYRIYDKRRACSFNFDQQAASHPTCWST